MPVRKATYVGVLYERDQLARELSDVRRAARDAVNRANARATALADDYRAAIDRLVEATARPPVVVQPPDTATIIDSVAQLVNGWRVVADQQPTPGLSFDVNADQPPVEEFVPPWENMGPPTHAGWINPPSENGNYTPYVPGSGNVIPPVGGVE